MCSAREGCLWIGTFTHLYRMNERGEVREVAPLPPPPPDRHVSTLLEDRAGRVWFGTFGDGLYLWNGTAFGKFRCPIAMSGRSSKAARATCGPARAAAVCAACGHACSRRWMKPVRQAARSLCVDARGDLGVALQSGPLFVRRGGKRQQLEDLQDWPGRIPTCVAADPTGNVWIGTMENDLVRWDGAAFPSSELQQGDKPRRLRAAFVAADGELWLARGESLVHRHRTQSRHPFSHGETDRRRDRRAGDKLGITTGTVRVHLDTIYGKLHVQSRTEAVVKFLRR